MPENHGDPGPARGGRAVRVLLVHEDAATRNALRAAMRDAGLSVVGQAGDASQAVYLAKRCAPDVILVDATLPPTGGVATMRALADAATGAQVVLLARSGEDEAGLAALSEGAAGYLSGEMDPASLARAVEGVAAGEAAISRQMALRVIVRLRDLSQLRAGMRPVKSPLTTREWEILDLLTAGMSTSDIAQRLVLTADTVRSHVSHILRKLRVHSRREAVEIAEHLREHPD
jgi:NarL family two-component system response regulator LiaR